MKCTVFKKIILFLFIFLIMSFINTISCFAVDYWLDSNVESIIQLLFEDNGSIKINRSDLMTSNFIFCRDKGTTLIDGAIYKKDTNVSPNPKTYPIITYYRGENKAGGTTTDISQAKSVKVEGADIAYVFGSYQNDSKKYYQYSDVQQAFWAILGTKYANNLNFQEYSSSKYVTDLSTLSEEAKDLYNKAVTYQGYVEKVEQHKINMVRANKIDEDTKDKYQPVLNKDNLRIEKRTEGDKNLLVISGLSADYAR